MPERLNEYSRREEEMRRLEAIFSPGDIVKVIGGRCCGIQRQFYDHEFEVYRVDKGPVSGVYYAIIRVNTPYQEYQYGCDKCLEVIHSTHAKVPRDLFSSVRW